MQEMAARTFGALKIALEKLTDMYSKPILFLVTPTWSPLCPYRHYTDSNNDTETFTYNMNQDFRRNLVFFGKTDRGVPICIKFVKRYSPEAHRFCARKGHAPELIAYEKLPGAWYMVVMGALAIYPYSRRIGSYKHFTPHFYPSLELKQLEEAVTALIGDLHNEGYVHGDLRDVNLLVRHDAQDRTKGFMLIDFDWAGEVHKTRYPRLVDRELVRRPSGAQDGMEILKDHDLEMLHFLFHPYG